MLRRTILAALAAATLTFAAPAVAEDPPEPVGRIDIDSTQLAFIFSGSFGGGKLWYDGKIYEFEIGGLGVGGIGASTIEADGEVYDMTDVRQFAGVYGQARIGYALADRSDGSLWLQNPDGVVLKLNAKREGAILSLGVDGMVIRWKN